MAAKVKKTSTKKKKATLKSSKKTAKKVKSVSKAASKPKKVAKAKSSPAKATKKVSAKKAPAKKVVTKKTAEKKTPAKKAAKPQKGLLTKLVGKLTSATEKKAPAKKVVEKKVKGKTPATKSTVEKKITEKKSVVKPEAKTKPAKAGKEISKAASDEAAAKVSQKNIAELTQEFAEKKISAASEVLLTDAEGRVLCKFSGCDEIANVEGYCRFHYLLNWKRIQLKKKILSEGKLEKYINELTAKYPDKYIDMLKGDLKSEKDFLSVVNELEIDDSDSSMSDDEEDNYIEQEVQGVSSGKRSNDEDY